MSLLLFFFFVLNLVNNISLNEILSEYEQCNAPLGMESGSIADSDLTSSSTHDVTSVGPQMARIRTEFEGGAWCPEKPIGPKSYEYIQIELHQLYYISAIETQGRFDNGQGNEYAEFYQIQYQRENNSSHWIDYFNKKTNKTLIRGNVNTYVAEKRFLTSAILAKRIRIIPYSSHWRTICMRVELYGCPFYGGILSYTTSPSIDPDPFYDGGVGKLTDGIIDGNENVWLAWNRSPVSIRFQFDISRQLKIIRIYFLNKKYRSIQIQFDQNHFIEHEISSQSTLISNVFVDTIYLNKYHPSMIITKTIELIFHFDSELLFLTEITFDNQPTMIVNTNHCQLGCSSIEKKNLTMTSSFSIFPLEWFPILVLLILFLCFIFLFILLIYRIRHYHLRRKTNNILYKTSHRIPPMQTNSNRIHIRNNYDDITSMGSYIYPITSTTSLIPTSSPSSAFKSEQYAMIDTYHYASSDITQISVRFASLFNCIALQEVVHPSNIVPTYPPTIDGSELFSLCKICESKFGEIFLGKYQSKSILIKILKTNFVHSSRDKFLSEINLLSRLNHRNLVSIYGIDLNSLYYIQEHSDLGTLKDYFHTQTNHSAFQKMNIYFAHQLSNALEYLSNENLIHKDIATRNCLLYPDLMIKLTDCAMALAQFEHEYWTCTNGEKIPLRWIAPEVLINKSTIKSDLYSFAVTLWEFWSHCSNLPHLLLSNEELYQYLIDNSTKSSIRLAQPLDCPKEIYDLLCECWHIDGTKRPNISDIVLYFKRQINLS